MKKVIAVLHQMKKGLLDDDYTLYDNGEVLHEFDKSIYPGGQNFKETFSANQLKPEIKERLISKVSDENIELAKNLLGLK